MGKAGAALEGVRSQRGGKHWDRPIVNGCDASLSKFLELEKKKTKPKKLVCVSILGKAATERS